MLHVDRSFARFSFSVLGFAALAVAFAAGSASAQIATRGQQNVGWCAIQARLTVKSFSLIIDKSRGDGYGRIVCDYADGSEEILPIRVKTKGMGIGVSLPNIYQESTANLFATGFGIAGGGAQALIGTYITGKGGVRLVNVGGDIGLSMAASRHGFSIPLTLQTLNARRRSEAVGFGLSGGYMQISIDSHNQQASNLRHLPFRRPVVQPGAAPLPPSRPRSPVVGASPAAAAPMAAPLSAPSPGMPGSAPGVAVPAGNPPVELQGSSESHVGANEAVDEATSDRPVARAN